jgi:hypothetical protein
MLDPLPQLAIAWALAALLGAAALHKLSAWQEWPGVVRNYALLPDAVAGVTAVLLPCAEALAAGALLWPASRPAGAAVAATLLAAYAVALRINLWRGRTMIDCGCFGARLRQGIAPWMVWRNVLLVLLAALLWLPGGGRALTAGDLVVAAAAVATLAFLYPVLAMVARPAPPTFEQNFHASRPRPGR